MTSKPIASEYLVPSLKMCPTSMPRLASSLASERGEGSPATRVADVGDGARLVVVDELCAVALPVEVDVVVVGLIAARRPVASVGGVLVDQQRQPSMASAARGLT
jgi:hypothetical protein